MGFLSKLFGGGGKVAGERLVLCLNSECGKIFKESQGKTRRKDLEISGFNDYKCPFCANEFACDITKLDKIQDKLKKQSHG